ncbi:Sporulation factor SpoIIGA [Pelotomaculum sp. FP]|uniref:sigma-E processing peptidase SpoIIGA n=1 Tax=Pelotomaculum sp. FP TaxID=261474 RepID=UPI0010658F8C|nr:sigma-E processing peptidase SpoIIGA [Pelotomaculum sp. FP]TEB17986.1 Sporulation factor SpoIIGA [Pelotomaculum sp. FP]
MPVYKVYLDQVFLGNLVMNYAILWAAAKLSRVPVHTARLVAGAALGAAYALAVFIPGAGFLQSVWFKTVISAGIVAVAFSPVTVRMFLTCLGCFFLASFTLGGLAIGIIFYLNSGRLSSWDGIGKVIEGNFWPGILLGLIALWAAGRGFAALLKKGKFENLFRIPILINSGGKQVRVEALLDTGNQLKDPLTQSPVVVVEYNSLKSLLPEQVQAGLERDGEADIWNILGSLSEGSLSSRFSAVPFQSLGRANGMMLGFRPDEVVIERQGKLARPGRVVVGIYRNKLDPEGSYHALLGPNVLELTG